MKATMTRNEAIGLLDFCLKHNIDEFFFAKDHGAYFGANTGTHGNDDFANHIVYLEGCNPNTDVDWHETASFTFGGDDFGEQLPISLLKTFMSNRKRRKFIMTLTQTELRFNF